MGYSVIGLNAIAAINSNNGLSVSANLSPTLTSYNSLPTVALATQIFNTAANVADSGLLTSTLKGLSSSGTVLYGITPTTGVPSFTTTISTQAAAPFSNGVAGFANVSSQVSTFLFQSFDVAGSAQLLKNKTYQTSGPGYTNQIDLVSGGLGTLAPVLSKAVSGFGTMYDINNLSMLGDPYVFCNNLLNQGLGAFGNLQSNLASVGITKSNILNSQAVAGSSPDVIVNILSQITGQDLLEIISATGFLTNTGAVNSLKDVLILSKVVSPDVVKALGAVDIVDLNGVGLFLNNRLGQGTFTSFADMSAMLGAIIVPNQTSIVTNSNSLVIASNTISTLASVTGTGTGPYNNPVMSDMLGSCAGIPYVANFSNITASIKTVNLSTVLANLTALYTTVNTYITGGTFNSTTVAPVASAVSAMNTYVASLMNNQTLMQSQTLYTNSYTHLTTEISLLNLANITIASPATTPNRLPDLARAVTSIGNDSYQFGLIPFYNALANNDSYGDSIRSAIAESFNSQLLQSKGIPFNNTVQPATKLAQAQSFGISITTLQQMAQ